ncbi:MAG: sulfotransferase [Gammaproteobacteria bacterium]
MSHERDPAWKGASVDAAQSLDPGALMAEAERLTGLADWGGDDFRWPFERLASAIRDQAQLSDIGRVRARYWLLHRLCQRLKLFDDRKRHPAIADQRVERPIFVTGLPRAGTTYTHALLGVDPAHVAPALWQWMSPSPPPNLPGVDHSNAIRDTERFIEVLGWNNPAILATHDLHARGVEECQFGFELSFVTMEFTGSFQIPGYLEVLAAGFGPAYRIHRKVLQAMQIGAEGRRWVLKAPEHVTHLEALFEEYPDAFIVQNHRDPAKVMASLLSVVANLQSQFTERAMKVDRNMALHFMSEYARSLAHVVQMRSDPAMNARFVDIHYLDLERRPLETMRRIYEHAQAPLSDAAVAAMRGWIETNRKGKHGKHRYRLADYGLTQEEVRAAFASYLRAFDIETESDGNER